MDNIKGSLCEQSQHRHMSGFTLMELMIVVAILGIAASIAIPSYKSTVSGGLVLEQQRELSATIAYVRSEASKSSTVTFCSSSDTYSDTPSCNATSNNDWNKGWIAFSDNNNDGKVNGDDVLLRVQGEQSNEITIRSSGFGTSGRLRFDSTGAISSVGTFTVCDSRGDKAAKAVVINISGQSRVAVDEDSVKDGIVNDHGGAGNNITCAEDSIS